MLRAGLGWSARASGALRDLDVLGLELHALAPEQAAADGPRLGPWTDVYLLGATLYRVLAGKALHGGGSITASLQRAWASAEVTLDDTVPVELAAIVRRATARATADRFASATEWNRTE